MISLGLFVGLLIPLFFFANFLYVGNIENLLERFQGSMIQIERESARDLLREIKIAVEGSLQRGEYAKFMNFAKKQEELEETVTGIAERIIRQSPLALKWAKKAINMSQETGLGAGMAYETLADCLLFSGKDREEGMKAFFEKRKPVFKGE